MLPSTCSLETHSVLVLGFRYVLNARSLIVLEHCAVRMVSIVHQTTMWIVIYEKIAFSMYNSNLLSEIMNGLSHILYQIKKYKK